MHMSLLFEDREVVRIGHHAEYVAERVDHRGGDETLVASRCDRLEFTGTPRQQPLHRCLDVLAMPVHDRSTGLGRRFRRSESALDEAEPRPVVAEAELTVHGSASLSR